MVDELIAKLEAFARGNEATNHPEMHALLRDVAGILRVLYDAVVETGTATHGAIPVVTMIKNGNVEVKQTSLPFPAVVTMGQVKMEAGPLAPTWETGRPTPHDFNPGEADSKESTPKGEG